jgi:PAS domain S-box-containing protein
MCDMPPRLVPFSRDPTRSRALGSGAVPRLFTAVRRWFADLPIPDTLQRRHAVTLQVFALALALAAFTIEVVRIASGKFSPLVAVVNGINGVICLLAAVLLRKGHYRRAAGLFVAGYGTVQAVAFALAGFQFSRDGIKNIGLCLTLAALLAGRRALWGMLAALTAAISIGYLRDLGWLGGAGPQPQPGSPLGVLWSSALSFVVLAIVLDRFGVTVQETLEQRQRAEEALRNSEELFRVAFQASPSAISISRLDDGVCMAVNPGFAQLWGYSSAEAVGRVMEELCVWDDPAARSEVLRALDRDGEASSSESWFRRGDGSRFLGAFLAKRFFLGVRPHVIAVTRDLTAAKAAEDERAQLQAQLLQAQKLDSVGRVAGGVAHDLNNLLTAVLGYADLLGDSLATETQRADLEQIREGAQRAAGLTRRLLSFARKQPVALRNVDVRALVEEMSGLLRRLAGEQIEFEVRTGDRQAVVLGDPGQLEQVILNLAVNARDAMPRGGSLTIAVGPLSVRERVPGLPPGEHVEISVSDTGCGMTPKVQQHLFEPFFTTKEPGKGTGLGLATCYGIVTQAGGQIAVESTPGKGSTFRIYLPQAPGGAQEVAPAQTARRGGSEVILLVEDDPALRGLVSRVLRSEGYNVLEASNGIDGLLTAASDPRDIDLLLTDVVMPRLGGRELAEKLRATRPRIRVLFTSGYMETPVAPAEQFLPKPFTASALLQQIRQTLGGPA